MEKNKTGKYLKYAIGEIILVVVGILIALQINNWNEGRKAITQEIKILKELKSDLKSTQKEVVETYIFTNNRQRSTVLILDYFEKASPVDDSLKKAFEEINMDGLFNIANTAYKFIENQGINILSNDSLRIRITQMYERQFKNIQNRETKNWVIINEELLPYMNEHFISSPTIDRNISFSVNAINTPKNINSLRKDFGFKNMILRLQNLLLVRLNWQKEALSELEELIKDIQVEIDRLSN
ncbi:MAG: hypothetical protein KJP20_04525 [Bacteroidia bacterium]|nr:hypothetical protein [Bacteroidia bacterium]NNF86887.1 hypothetical protein [Winogradskyella sp.]